ncbi:hypothetical protein [Sandaracinus amylolyticus]|uniref:hypothetical protein n=1 Tax=Sandaracinus amylolyticus TaxID=927083 RepID=UPI001F1BA8F9|nr:hypothetical protein [Sandaracinus amylolyticus]UJR82774.1 Hypothetical protein I5071_48390 [Sandaracinus amylolyticus]
MRLACAVLVLVAGCGGSLDRVRHLEPMRRADSCARITDVPWTALDRAAGSDRTRIDAMPDDVRRVAEAARLDDAMLGDRIVLVEHLLVLHADLGGAIAEVDCLSDQLEDLQAELADREAAFSLTVTLVSIAVGALTATASGVIDLATHDDLVSAVVQIIGGAAATALGVIAFFPPNETLTLEHDRNVLRVVRDARDADDVTRAPFVMRMLVAPRVDGPSPRETLERRWSDTFALVDDDMPALIFGNGGRYDRDALRTREVVLEQLEAELQLLRQDYELLSRYLFERSRDAPP